MRFSDWLKRGILSLIRKYQRSLSPALPARCRFCPTCSQYAVEAIEYYGLVRGGLKSVWRFLRCNPFSKGGYDPPVSEDHKFFRSSQNSDEGA